MSDLTVDGALQRLCEWRDPVDSEALQVLRDNWEEALPILIHEIESTEPPDPEDGSLQNPLFHAVFFLCGELGEEQALQPLLECCVTESNEESLLQEISLRALAGVLAHCCGKNPDPLIQFFSNLSVPDYARMNAYRALVQLLELGYWTRSEFEAWFTFEMREGDGKSSLLRSYLFSQGLYFVPEIAQKEGAAFFNSGEGDHWMEEVFDSLNQQIVEGQVLDRSVLFSPLGTADQELQAIMDDMPSEEEERFYAFLDFPESLFEIFDNINLEPEYELLENSNIRRNASCPCGSGKKYKKCCIGKAFVRVPSSQLTWKNTLITDDDLLASKFMEAGFLYRDAEDYVAVMVSGIFFADLLRPKIPKTVTHPDDVEARGLFVGYESLAAWITLFLNSVTRFLIVGSPIGLEAEGEVRWIVDQFGDKAPLEIRKIMLITLVMLDMTDPSRFEHTLKNLKQLLEWDPDHIIAVTLLANLYQNHPTKSDPEKAREILEARLELEFEEEGDRLIVQDTLDRFVADTLSDG